LLRATKGIGVKSQISSKFLDELIPASVIDPLLKRMTVHASRDVGLGGTREARHENLICLVRDLLRAQAARCRALGAVSSVQVEAAVEGHSVAKQPLHHQRSYQALGSEVDISSKGVKELMEHYGIVGVQSDAVELGLYLASQIRDLIPIRQHCTHGERHVYLLFDDFTRCYSF